MEREVKQNNAALDDSAGEFDDAKKSADKFGDEVKETGRQTEDASEKFKKVGQSLKAVGAAMATAVAAIGTAAVATGKKLWDMASETAQAGDEIDKTSQKLGMSAEAYQEWDYVLGQAGVDITSMTTGLKTMTNQIDDAKNGSEKAQERFKKLGISMSDLQSMSREDVFAAVVKGFQGMADTTERAALANDIFGKSGQNLTPLFNETTESTEELMKAAHDLGFVMSDEAVKASADFQDSLDTLKRTFSGVKNNLVGELLPGFSQVMYGLSDMLVGGKDAKEKIQNGVSEIVESLKGIFPRVVDILMTLIGAVAEIAPVIIDSLIQGLVGNMSGIVSAASKIIITFMQSLVAALPQIAEGALDLVLQLADAILDNLPLLAETAIQVIATLMNGIATALPTLIPTIVSAILGVVQVHSAIPLKEQRKRVAAYARVSSGKDAMLHSLSAQVSYYNDLIQSRSDWLYCGVYSDEAITGTKTERRGFQALLSDCRAGKLDMVIVKSISRLARNTVTLLETVRELKCLGVDVFFEEQNIHTMSADGELMLTILASYAQEESLSVSENQKWRVRKNFSEGKPWGCTILLQKEFTTDFLTKKRKVNEGEVPQYYIEHSHEAIIDPEEWDAVQEEFRRRKAIGKAYSGKSVLASKIVCADCGYWYGAKTWHSKDKYKTVVWQCNQKYDKSKPICKTPHVTEESVKERFLKVYNGLIENKKPYIDACKAAIETLTDTTELDNEIEKLLQEMDVVAGLIKKSISENASAAQDQTEYNNRYNAYADRYEQAKSKYDELTAARDERIAKRNTIKRFLTELKKRNELLTEFDNCLWLTVIDRVTVQQDGSLIFRFYNGTEISS